MSAQTTILYNEFENYTFKNYFHISQEAMNHLGLVFLEYSDLVTRRINIFATYFQILTQIIHS